MGYDGSIIINKNIFKNDRTAYLEVKNCGAGFGSYLYTHKLWDRPTKDSFICTSTMMIHDFGEFNDSLIDM